MEKEMDLLLLLLLLIILLNTVSTVITIITTTLILGISYIEEDCHGRPFLHSFLTNTGQVSAQTVRLLCLFLYIYIYPIYIHNPKSPLLGTVYPFVTVQGGS